MRADFWGLVAFIHLSQTIPGAFQYVVGTFFAIVAIWLYKEGQ